MRNIKTALSRLEAGYLAFLEKNPDVSAAHLRVNLNLSQPANESVLESLLRRGLIEKTKVDSAWLYRVTLNPRPWK